MTQDERGGTMDEFKLDTTIGEAIIALLNEGGALALECMTISDDRGHQHQVTVVFALGALARPVEGAIRSVGSRLEAAGELVLSEETQDTAQPDITPQEAN